jgi:dolichol-phosphate mannosyltransferase
VTTGQTQQNSIAVVIPCYKVKAQILSVLEQIGPEVSVVYVVDDCCPQGTGRFVRQNSKDPRVVVLHHEKNQGVGGAMITGYKQAISNGHSIAVKIDGDGQMDPRLLTRFVQPILEGRADYTKGNRLYSPELLTSMPFIRLFGNAGLSFMTKVSTGYWNVMDPVNGYTAIHTKVLRVLPLDKIDRGYFFETDILLRLNLVRAAVVEIPMQSKYEDEESNLKISRILFEFPAKHFQAGTKRFVYTYLMRDFNLCSLQFIFGALLFAGGSIFGLAKWWEFSHLGVAAATGTIMLATLPIILGFQLLLAAVGYDIINVPRNAVHPVLDDGSLSFQELPSENKQAANS